MCVQKFISYLEKYLNGTYTSAVFIIMMNENIISRIGDRRHVKHAVVPLDLAAHTL